VLGLGDHRLEQAAVGLLDPSPPVKLGLGIAKPDRERVPNPLELGGSEQARPPDRADAPVDPLAREGRGEKLTQPLLERGDLTAKVVARPSLHHRAGIAVDERSIQQSARPRRRVDRLDLHQLLGHEALLPESRTLIF
jgi:hypothetical protein